MNTNTLSYPSSNTYPSNTYPNMAAYPNAATYPNSDAYPNGGTYYNDGTYQHGIGAAEAPTINVVRPVAQPVSTGMAPDDARESEARSAQVRYGVGAAITAVLAALTGLVGLILAHGILGISVMFGSGSTLTPIGFTEYGFAAAGIALLAAGLFGAMVRIAPKPATYYAWLTGMVTLLAGLLPFTTTAGLHSQIALAVINVAVGLVIAVGIPLAASNARS
jgi:hypothetical protein